MWSRAQRQHVGSFRKKVNGLTEPSCGNLVDACQAVAHSTCASKLMMLILNTKLHMYVHVYNIPLVKVNLLFVFGKYKYCSHKRREENQLDATECFIALIICSTCFVHLYAHHQELETILVLLPHMVCNALVTGGRRSVAGQQAMRPG